MTSRIPPEQVIADMLLAIRSEERLAERKRIIKLLEEAEPCECNPSWSYRCDTHFRIALIKGENK